MMLVSREKSVQSVAQSLFSRLNLYYLASAKALALPTRVSFYGSRLRKTIIWMPFIQPIRLPTSLSLFPPSIGSGDGKYGSAIGG